MRKLLAGLLCACGCSAGSGEGGGAQVRWLDRGTFDASVQPLLAERCANPTCHGRPERGLSLFAPRRFRADPGRIFFDEPLSEAELQHNYAASCALATETARAGRSLLLLKPLGELAGVYHGGGSTFVSIDDPEYRTLLAWANGERPDDGADEVSEP